MATKSSEHESSERLIGLIIRKAANYLDMIRMEDVVFTMQYMATHLSQGSFHYENAFVFHLEIASELATGGPDILRYFKNLTELLCNFIPSMDKRRVDFLDHVLLNWRLCLAKIPAEQRPELLGSIGSQLFETCRRFMVEAPSFSLQLKMLEILHLYYGSAMIGFLRSNELPRDGSAYFDFRGSIDSFVYKQEYLHYINMSRKNNDLILSLPLESVKCGPNLMILSRSENRVWLHWNQRVRTFEFWFNGMKVTIFDNQLELLTMKRNGPCLNFTLNRPPEFENRFGKKFHPSMYQFNFVEVSFDDSLHYEWRFPLQDTFGDRFRYQNVLLKRSSSETMSDDGNPEKRRPRHSAE